jgi:hypothetical protein
MGDLDCFLDLSLQKNKLNNKVPIIIIDMEQYILGYENSIYVLKSEGNKTLINATIRH